jgi:hypothetical protein
MLGFGLGPVVVSITFLLWSLQEQRALDRDDRIGYVDGVSLSHAALNPNATHRSRNRPRTWRLAERIWRIRRTLPKLGVFHTCKLLHCPVAECFRVRPGQTHVEPVNTAKIAVLDVTVSCDVER